MTARSLALILLCVLTVGVSAAKASERPFPTVETAVLLDKGVKKKLQPEILDFRYSPYRWQTCIGLPDDPHKSIVGSDGGLYYDYGGGRFYGFKTRISASLNSKGDPGKAAQSL